MAASRANDDRRTRGRGARQPPGGAGAGLTGAASQAKARAVELGQEVVGGCSLQANAGS